MSRSCSAMSEEELGRELRRLAATLSSSSASGRIPGAVSASKRASDEWGLRKDALEQLRRFAEEDVSSRPVFAQLVSTTVKTALLEQLADKRVAIVRGACKAIAAFARYSTNGALWAGMCVWLVQPLLGLTASTVKGVAQAAEDALQVAASSRGFSAEALGELLKGCRARHETIRLQAMRTLLSFMRQSKGTAQQVRLAKFALPVSRVIESGVVDASEQVRKTSRHCYWALHAMEPEAASRLFDRLEASTKALIGREKADALRIVGSVEVATQGTADAGGNAGGGRPSFRSGGGGSPPRQRTARATGQQEELNALHDDLQTVAAVRARSSSAPARLRQGSLEKAKSVSPSPSLPHPAPPQEDAYTAHATAPAPSGDLMVTTLKPTITNITTTTTITSVGDAVSVPASVSMKQWKLVQDALVSTDWEMRRDAVMSLPHAMEGMLGDREMLSGTLAELVCRLSDPHFRVCLAALECFRLVAFTAEAFPLLVDSYLPSTLLALLTDVCSRKEAVRHQAAAALVTLIERLNPRQLEHSLLQCLDDIATPMVRARTLEVLQLVFSRHWEQYADPLVAGPVLRALVHQLRAAGKEANTSGGTTKRTADYTWVPTVSALQTLQSKVPESLSKVIATLNGDDQDLVRRALADPAAEQENRVLVLIGSAGVAATERIHDKEGSLPLLKPRSSVDKKPVSSSLTALCDASPAAQAPTADPPPPPFPHSAHRESVVREKSASVARRYTPQTQPTAQTDLFSSEFAMARFVDPNEPHSARYPCGREGTDMEEDRPKPDAGRAPGAAAAANSPLIRERYRSLTSTAEGAAPAATQLSLLCSPNATCDELSSTLDSVLVSLASSSDRWAEDELQDLFGFLLERGCTEHAQPHHGVRCRSFSVLRALFDLPSMRSVAARHLNRVLRVCRAGLDDAFYEVQQGASLAMHTVRSGCHLPVDLWLNGLAGVIEVWQRGKFRDDCTRGWLEMLSEVGRTFERVHTAQAARLRNSDPNVMMTEAVLRRVVRVVHWCAGHCAAEVRRTSILLLVAMWLAMGKGAFTFFVCLSATQRKLVSLYYNKAVLSKQQPLGAALRGSPPRIPTATGDQGNGRDLSTEMRAAGFPEATSL